MRNVVAEATRVMPALHDAFVIGSLNEPHDVSLAAEHVQRGDPVAFQVGGVFGLMVDGAHQEAIEAVLRLKEDKQGRKFSGMLKTQRFLSYVDHNRVHPGVVALLDDPTKFDETIAQICHIRAPITPKAVADLPPSMVSYEGVTPYLHNLDVGGHPLDRLNIELERCGVFYRGVTTLNRHKREPEITEVKAAVEFCTDESRKGQISLLLTDPTPRRPKVRGSFPIVDLTHRDNGKLAGKRHGRIPFSLVGKIIGVEIDVSGAEPAAYEQDDFSSLLREDRSPQELRSLAIAFMSQS